MTHEDTEPLARAHWLTPWALSLGSSSTFCLVNPARRRATAAETTAPRPRRVPWACFHGRPPRAPHRLAYSWPKVPSTRGARARERIGERASGGGMASVLRSRTRTLHVGKPTSKSHRRADSGSNSIAGTKTNPDGNVLWEHVRLKASATGKGRRAAGGGGAWALPSSPPPPHVARSTPSSRNQPSSHSLPHPDRTPPPPPT